MTGVAVRRQTNIIPKPALVAASGLIAITVLGAASARLSGLGRPEDPRAQAIQSVDLRFEDQPDGGVLVRRAGDGAMIYRVAPETNGFMRATVRGLARERRRSDVGDAVPFVLTAWSDGRLTLDDSTTSRRVSLEAFGETNARAFADLLTASGSAR